MKKLVCAAMVAVSMCAMADEAKKDAAPAVAPNVEQAKQMAPRRSPMTAEQRQQKMREQREKFMAERKAAMEAKMLEVVKKYVPEEEKAKALVKDLQEAMTDGRRNMMMRRPMPKAAKPAEAAK